MIDHFNIEVSAWAWVLLFLGVLLGRWIGELVKRWYMFRKGYWWSCHECGLSLKTSSRHTTERIAEAHRAKFHAV